MSYYLLKSVKLWTKHDDGCDLAVSWHTPAGSSTSFFHTHTSCIQYCCQCRKQLLLFKLQRDREKKLPHTGLSPCNKQNKRLVWVVVCTFGFPQSVRKQYSSSESLWQNLNKNNHFVKMSLCGRYICNKAQARRIRHKLNINIKVWITSFDSFNFIYCIKS